MKIHASLLTHDGIAPKTAGKVLDLGFDGDFDTKNTSWNMVFVSCPKTANATADMKVKVYTKQSGISNIVSDANAIGEFVITTAQQKKGGAYGIVMPRGLKRYFTLGITSTGTIAASVTAGITDDVDTDLSFNWQNYKADTASTEVAEVRAANTKDLTEHASKTSGVHGL